MSTRGNGEATILFIVFLTLKLTGAVEWSWVWVTAPLWIPISMIALLLFISELFNIWRNK